MRARYFYIGLLALTLSVCWSANSYAQANTEQSVSMVKNLIRVPMARQNVDYTCGVTALQSILGYYGFDKRLDVLSAEVKPDPASGTNYLAIANYANALGFDVSIQTNMTLDDLKGYIDQKIPFDCTSLCLLGINRSLVNTLRIFA